MIDISASVAATTLIGSHMLVPDTDPLWVFFDVDGADADRIGTEVANLQAAEAAAVEALGFILNDIGWHRPLSRQVRIRSPTGEILSIVSVAVAVERLSAPCKAKLAQKP